MACCVYCIIKVMSMVGLKESDGTPITKAMSIVMKIVVPNSTLCIISPFNIFLCISRCFNGFESYI